MAREECILGLSQMEHSAMGHDDPQLLEALKDGLQGFEQPAHSATQRNPHTSFEATSAGQNCTNGIRTGLRAHRCIKVAHRFRLPS
jgi:hypothetical protein